MVPNSWSSSNGLGTKANARRSYDAIAEATDAPPDSTTISASGDCSRMARIASRPTPPPGVRSISATSIASLLGGASSASASGSVAAGSGR
jgi:hypothetical protein